MAEPTVPPAPPRLSTMIGCPRAAPSLSPTTRAMMSVVLPAVNGTITLIGLLGQVGCAAAPDATALAAMARRRPRILFVPMLCTLVINRMVIWMQEHGPMLIGTYPQPQRRAAARLRQNPVP